MPTDADSYSLWIRAAAGPFLLRFSFLFWILLALLNHSDIRNFSENKFVTISIQMAVGRAEMEHAYDSYVYCPSSFRHFLPCFSQGI